MVAKWKHCPHFSRPVRLVPAVNYGSNDKPLMASMSSCCPVKGRSCLTHLLWSLWLGHSVFISFASPFCSLPSSHNRKDFIEFCRTPTDFRRTSLSGRPFCPCCRALCHRAACLTRALAKKYCLLLKPKDRVQTAAALFTYCIQFFSVMM